MGFSRGTGYEKCQEKNKNFKKVLRVHFFLLFHKMFGYALPSVM